VAETTAIDIRDLRKTYGAVEALRGLDLQVPAGSICGFLGRNGAGKTTTIKVLLGMSHATSGSCFVLGHDASDAAASVEIRRRIGFAAEEKDLYPFMTAGEMVDFTSRFFPRWRKDLQERYLRKFGLPADRRVKALSRGMRTRLALLLAICRGAELLILDEPTSGLDPAAAEEVLQILVSHSAGEGTTIFFSSHQIAEVEQVADRVAIVDKGRTVLAGSLDDIGQSYRRIQAAYAAEPPASVEAPGIVSIVRKGRGMTILASGNSETIAQRARANGALSVEVSAVTLKDIFLATIDEEA